MKLIIKSSLFAFFFLALTSIQAQDATGAWKGTLSVQGTELEMTFNILKDGEALSATLDVPAQGAVGIELDNVTLAENVVTILSAKLQLKYEGTLNGDEITGTYNQAGQSFPLNLKKTVKTKPGNTALPTSSEELAKIAAFETGNFKYSVEDFFQSPSASYFKLSPNGENLSYLKRTDEGKNNLYVKNTKTQEEKLIVAVTEDVISGYFWANNDRVLYLQDQGGNENFHIFGVNVDGSNKKDLTPYEGVKANILVVMRDDKDHIIITLNKDNPQLEEPFKLNIETGVITKIHEQKLGQAPIMGYDFDKDGNLKAITSVVNTVETELKYNIDGEFKTIFTGGIGENFSILKFNYQTDNPHDAYVLSNQQSDKAKIQLYDLKEQKVIKNIYSNKEYDATTVGTSKYRNYELDFIYFNGDKMTIIPVSKTYKKVHNRLKKEFGEKQFFPAGRSEDESTFMAVVTSDKIVGEYYIYDVKTDEVTLLYKLLPQLEESDMAMMKPIKYTSRDGLTIHGYITLPKEALAGKKVPLIVMPHGGPQGMRDSWGFLPDNQLFASRGYATLNVNFRISGGYGKEFLKAGFKQIGRKAMNDVEDGIKYAIQQGWIDKDKVGIFGASHGGYAVLRGMTKTPELYACGVDYVGVSNVNTFMNSIPAYWEKYKDFLYAIWYNPNIPEEKIIMDEVSPALHADKIIRPLMVVQGANDPRVNINEADQIVENVRARNIEVPYMVKYDEGHGFRKEENRIELYKIMMGFFAKNLK